MNKISIRSINDIVEFKMNIKLSSDDIFLIYLTDIYSNLLLREETFGHSNSIVRSRNSLDFKLLGTTSTSKKLSLSKRTIPKIVDKGICLNSFLEYMNIQDFIGERIFKYLNKSKGIKLNKSDFTNGLNKLYYSDIKNLIKFTFFLADFNDDGKIYKSDMKLLLAYIPSSTEFSQKLKLKQINKIINIFFDENINNPEEGTEKEISYDLYSKNIHDYIEDSNNSTNNNSNNHIDSLNEYNNNAPFFYFISILSYLFNNCPFNVKNVDYYVYSQKKIKTKVILRNIHRSSSVKHDFITTAKKNGNFNDSQNNILEFSAISAVKHDKNKNKLAPITKIGQKNLFNMKKRSNSQKNIVCENLNDKDKYMSFINKKKENKKDSIICINKNELNFIKNQKEYNLFNSKFKNSDNHLQNLTNMSLNLIKKGSSPIPSVSLLINNISSSPQINLKLAKNSTNDESISNSNKSSSNNNLIDVRFNNSKIKLPSITKEKMTPFTVGAKLKKEDKDCEEPGDFVLCEYSGSEDNDENEDNETYLYKFCEDSYGNFNILNKFYGVLSEKEILFFSNDLKNELCDLWYIFKGHITTGKEEVNNQIYYTININFFNNNIVNKLFFIKENICQKFAKRIKKSIHDLDFYDYYELKEKLGHGHFATVNKCKNKLSGQMYAVKIINKNELKSIDLELIQQEKSYLSLLKHPNIVSLKDYFEDKKFIYLVTECCNGGDLLSFIENHQKEKKPISEKTTAKIIRKIAEGIKYLNYFGIVHRDIKPENILFSEENEIKTLKIIDLGVCQTLTYGEMTSEPIGTNGYISPEIYMHKEYSFEADIWSLGIILYLLITEGILPFDHEDMDYKIIGKKVLCLRQECPEEYFGNKSKGLILLLDKMLEKTPSKRININNLLKDSWFNIIKT